MGKDESSKKNQVNFTSSKPQTLEEKINSNPIPEDSKPAKESASVNDNTNKWAHA